MQWRAAVGAVSCGGTELLMLRDAGIPFRCTGSVRPCRRLEQQGQPTVAHRLARREVLDDWPDLDRAVLRGGDVARQCQCLIEVFGFEHVVAARHLGAFRERAVGDRRRVGSTGDPRAGRRRGERVSGPDRRRRLGVERLVGRHLGGRCIGVRR